MIPTNLYLAAEVAARFFKDEKRHFALGAIGVRKDGAIVSARNGSCQSPNRHCHAEFRLCKKLDVGAVVYVSRVKKDGSFGCARPCPACAMKMRSTGVHKCYYSIDNTSYGTMDL